MLSSVSESAPAEASSLDRTLSPPTQPRSTLAVGGAPWQEAIRQAIRDPGELCRALALPPAVEAAARRAGKSFPIFMPRGYLARIRPCDPNDPLLRQVLPLDDELAIVPGYVHDPVGDMAAERSAGLLQKYRARVLIVATGACAVHCRYCFRRHFPYSEATGRSDHWAEAVDTIAADRSISEVILSGGDPLMLVDDVLADLAARLAAIPHLRRLRVHTRLPIMVPERVDARLLDWLSGTRLTPVMVIHANHPAELGSDVAAAVARLVERRVMVLNQAVLLRGVNDSVECLAELSERLIDLRVTPYYLHQLDRVAGAAHFEVPEDRGRAIVAELRRRLPGYAVPRYVRETAGADYKVDVGISNDE